MFTYVMNNLEQRRRTWFLHIGFVPVPKKWYAPINPEIKINNLSVSHTPRTEIGKAIKKMEKGIYALIKNPDIETRNEMYEILKERKFLPFFKWKTGTMEMSEARFDFYYTKVINAKKYKRKRFSKTNYIRDNYLTMSVDIIAKNAGTTRLFVQQTICRIKRGLV